jgi:hypothetical protein
MRRCLKALVTLLLMIILCTLVICMSILGGLLQATVAELRKIGDRLLEWGLGVHADES